MGGWGELYAALPRYSREALIAAVALHVLAVVVVTLFLARAQARGDPFGAYRRRAAAKRKGE